MTSTGYTGILGLGLLDLSFLAVDLLAQLGGTLLVLVNSAVDHVVTVLLVHRLLLLELVLLSHVLLLHLSLLCDLVWTECAGLRSTTWH